MIFDGDFRVRVVRFSAKNLSEALAEGYKGSYEPLPSVIAGQLLSFLFNLR